MESNYYFEKWINKKEKDGIMATLSRGKITDVITDYEMSHPVDTFKLSEIHVWPILRMQAASALYRKKEVTGHGFKKYIKIIKKNLLIGKQLLLFRTHLMKNGLHYPTEGYKPDFSESDLVFLTPTHARQIMINGKFYDIYVDAFLDQLSNINFSTLIWEINQNTEYRLPPYRNSVLISHFLFRTNVMAFLNSYKILKIKVPKWYREYAEWLKSLNGSPIKYHDFLLFVDLLLRQAKLFEKWLRNIRPKALFVICWYSPTSMAATLAASRLGIKTVDFQHGLQGINAFAYASWKKSPPNKYELIPKYFWTWGEIDSHSIRSSSCQVISPENVIIGGYPWINLWRYEHKLPAYCHKYMEEAKCLTMNKSRSILVTLQAYKHIDNFEILFQAIQNSPSNWQWLLRMHPNSFDDKNKINMLAQKSKHPNIDIEKASELPLYALLKAVDIHLTWWSTCALECIPFGIPTIIIHENGKEAFDEFIKRGDMIFANNTKEIIHQIAHSEPLKKTNVEKIFAGKRATEKAINTLLLNTT